MIFNIDASNSKSLIVQEICQRAAYFADPVEFAGNGLRHINRRHFPLLPVLVQGIEGSLDGVQDLFRFCGGHYDVEVLDVLVEVLELAVVQKLLEVLVVSDLINFGQHI